MIGLDTSFLVAFEITDHPGHASARELAAERIGAGERLALAPQVLTEFVHVVTDQRRFTSPIPVHEAIDRSRQWWNAIEVTRTAPDDEAVVQFLKWMLEFELGRKKLPDTMLAATYRAAGISTILTTDARDFARYPGMHPLLVR